MNFSPLNDPEFEKYRKQAAANAAAKRRKKTLIILGVVAVCAALITVLVVFAAMDIIPKLADAINAGREEQPQNGGNTGGNGGVAVETTETPTPDTPTPAPQVSTPDTPTPVTPDTPTPVASTETPYQPVEHRTTIYVDAGHGFMNAAGDAIDRGSGNASTPYGVKTKELYGKVWYEADLTVLLSKKVKALLEEAGYNVIISREDYVYEPLPISARAERAAAAGADLLVSIHADAADADAHGARVFYNYTPTWIKFSESKALAQKIAEYIDAFGASTKATKVWGDTEFNKDKTLAMLRGTGDIPSALIEMLFLTNEGDASLAVTEEWQDSMAKAIVGAITDFCPLKIWME